MNGEMRYGARLRVRQKPTDSGSWYDTVAHPLPDSCGEPPGILVRDQKSRTTCVAMAMAGLCERARRPIVPLSVEHLYFLSKTHDDSMATCGTYLMCAGAALESDGITTEEIWPYRSYAPCNLTGEHPPAAAGDTRHLTKLATTKQPEHDVDALRQKICDGRVIAISFEVFPSFDDEATQRSGEVHMPSRDEAPLSLGHAVLLWGYVVDPASPGNGYFRFQNSRGTGWGAAGMGMLPFDYVRHYASEAFSY